MIEVHRLTKYYGQTPSIQDLTFQVPEGEVLGFLGPNGAGKSTTMRILSGLLSPTEGKATIMGMDVQKEAAKVYNHLGYLPESAPVYGDMTLFGYLKFMGGMKNIPSKQIKKEVERCISELNLVAEQKRLIRNLSKGTRQRAAIAQAMLGHPKILILDEPTVGLDPSQINDIRELIRSFKGKHTVILSTHILPEVELTCSRVVIINQGRIAANGTPEELYSKLDQRLIIEFRGDISRVKELAASHTGSARIETRKGISPGSQSIVVHSRVKDEQRSVLTKELINAGIDLLDFHQQVPSLEDVFLEVTGRRAAAK